MEEKFAPTKAYSMKTIRFVALPKDVIIDVNTGDIYHASNCAFNCPILGIALIKDEADKGTVKVIGEVMNLGEVQWTSRWAVKHLNYFSRNSIKLILSKLGGQYSKIQDIL